MSNNAAIERLKEICFEGEIEEIVETIVKNPITIKKIIDIIKLSGELESDGIDVLSHLNKLKDPCFRDMIHGYEKLMAFEELAPDQLFGEIE